MDRRAGQTVVEGVLAPAEEVDELQVGIRQGSRRQINSLKREEVAPFRLEPRIAKLEWWELFRGIAIVTDDPHLAKQRDGVGRQLGCKGRTLIEVDEMIGTG